MRKICLDMVYELAQKDERVVFIGSDLGCNTLDVFQQELPERFFMEGVCEANVVGMAAGMALEGYIPYVNTIASFLARRSYEQVVVDLCLHNLPVRLIGNGGGLVYAPLGPTHHTFEDIATMRALPNMCVLCPADAEEMRRLMPRTLDWPGPIYIRLAKGWDPVVTDADQAFEIGKVFTLREGGDALIISTGVMLEGALEAADMLAEQGIETRVAHVPTIKPLDVEALTEHLAGVRAAVTVEEHSVFGGLGGAVAEIVAEGDFPGLRFKRMGLPDIFTDRYGTQRELWARYGLTGKDVAATLQGLL